MKNWGRKSLYQVLSNKIKTQAWGILPLLHRKRGMKVKLCPVRYRNRIYKNHPTTCRKLLDPSPFNAHHRHDPDQSIDRAFYGPLVYVDRNSNLHLKSNVLWFLKPSRFWCSIWETKRAARAVGHWLGPEIIWLLLLRSMESLLLFLPDLQRVMTFGFLVFNCSDMINGLFHTGGVEVSSWKWRAHVPLPFFSRVRVFPIPCCFRLAVSSICSLFTAYSIWEIYLWVL